ncbi:MAG: hypothetical protein CMJ85_07115 [Planctomycetes bacterium]|nr:hypothetical protein [Planctomycetota bacterium]
MRSSRWVLIALVPLALSQRKNSLTETDPKLALDAAPKAIQTITAVDLERHAKKLASEEFQGRLTGTPGQEKAAKLFADHFRQLKLKPLGARKRSKAGPFAQGYPIELDGFGAKTGVYAATGKRIAKHGAWFVRFRNKSKVEVKGKLVFCGVGDTAVAAKASIAVLHFDTEGSRDGRYLMGKLRSLASKAAKFGAKGCVLVMKEMPSPLLAAFGNSGVSFPGRPAVSNPKARRGRGGNISAKVPTVLVSGKDAEGVLSRIGLSPDMAYDAEEDLAVGKKSKSNVRLTAIRKKQKKKALNICAYIEGRHKKLKSEAIVFSCHMDHLGLTADGGCFNGADDNASGSSTVLEIAEAFAKLKPSERPQRSVIFLAVSGEELGLWGSAHFVDNPTWPIKKIIADINMDMLGRNTDKVPNDTVALTPTYRINYYSTLARETAWLGKAFGLQMANGDRFFQRSDHWNFAKKGLPVVFFCDDEHADYHMPTDTAEKLDYAKMEKIARLAFLIGYRTANAKGKPKKLGRRKDWFK